MKTAARLLRVALTMSLALLVLLASCATTHHGVEILPVKSAVPVSASAYYIDSAGRVWGPQDYRVVESFSFEKTGTAAYKTETRNTIDVTRDLESIVSRADASAIVNMRVIGYEFDPSMSQSIKVVRPMGWTFVGTGAFMVLFGIALDDVEIGLYVGAPFALIGGGLLVASYVMPGETTWRIRFEGDAVQ